MLPNLPVFQLPVLGWWVRIDSYSAAHLAALLVLVAVTLRLYARDIRPTSAALDPFLVGIPVAMLGARLLGGLTAHTRLPGHVWPGPSALWVGHRSAYGGMLAGVAAAALVARLRRLNVPRFLDAGAPGLAFATCLARLGCFLGGCCFGRPTASLLGVRFPEGHPGMAKLLPGDPRGLHPTQLYLAASALGIGLLLLVLRRRGPGRPGHRFALAAALYAATTFAIEFLRDDPGRWFGLGVSHSQWISGAIFVASALVLGHAALGGLLRRPAPALAAGLLLLTLTATRAHAQNLREAFDTIAEGLLARNPNASLLVARLVELGGGGPLTTWARIAKGADALLEGDLGGAIVELQAAAAADPGTAWSAQAELALGLAHAVRAAAVDAFTAAAEHGEGQTVAYAAVSLGRLQAAAGDQAAAERSFRRVLDKYPGAGVADDAALGLVESLVAQDRPAEARDVLALAHERYWHRGVYMVARRNHRLGFDRLARLAPAKVAGELRARAERAIARDESPLYAMLAALTDRYAGADLERQRRRLGREAAVAPEPATAPPGLETAAAPSRLAAATSTAQLNTGPQQAAPALRLAVDRVLLRLALAVLALLAVATTWRLRPARERARGGVARPLARRTVRNRSRPREPADAPPYGRRCVGRGEARF